jgi:hypothetical protein
MGGSRRYTSASKISWSFLSFRMHFLWEGVPWKNGFLSIFTSLPCREKSNKSTNKFDNNQKEDFSSSNGDGISQREIESSFSNIEKVNFQWLAWMTGSVSSATSNILPSSLPMGSWWGSGGRGKVQCGLVLCKDVWFCRNDKWVAVVRKWVESQSAQEELPQLRVLACFPLSLYDFTDVQEDIDNGPHRLWKMQGKGSRVPSTFHDGRPAARTPMN